LTPEGREEAERLARLTQKSIDIILERIPQHERERAIRSIRLLRQAAEQTRAHLDCC